MTSDIAHELKTPIAELINLAEVTLKFPNDPSLKATFTSDVLDISKRLEKVVSSIMLFHRYNNECFELNDVFDAAQVITRLSANYKRVQINSQPDMFVTSNLFAFETILTNLFNNAVTYSPKDSVINVDIGALADKSIQISVSNLCTSSLSQQDLKYIFDPLWQKDSARTSTENFGLGLSIVNSFTKALGGTIGVEIENEVIYFRVNLKQ